MVFLKKEGINKMNIREKAIIIRVTDKEKKKIKEIAKKRGLTLSEYLRSKALGIRTYRKVHWKNKAEKRTKKVLSSA